MRLLVTHLEAAMSENAGADPEAIHRRLTLAFGPDADAVISLVLGMVVRDLGEGRDPEGVIGGALSILMITLAKPANARVSRLEGDVARYQDEVARWISASGLKNDHSNVAVTPAELKSHLSRLTAAAEAALVAMMDPDTAWTVAGATLREHERCHALERRLRDEDGHYLFGELANAPEYAVDPSQADVEEWVSIFRQPWPPHVLEVPMAEPRLRPLSLWPDLVRAVLEGQKTQTRRLIVPTVLDWQWVHSYGDGSFGRVGPDFESNSFTCPFGQAGDRLWVRERARVVGVWDRHGPPMVRVRYEADGTDHLVTWPDRLKPVALGRCIPNGVHREGARLFLEVTEVRAQRLQDITEADARAEGVEPTDDPFQEGNEYWRCYRSNCEGRGGECPGVPSARESFETLWGSINGPESWDANPWVWALTFRRVEASR